MGCMRLSTHVFLQDCGREGLEVPCQKFRTAAALVDIGLKAAVSWCRDFVPLLHGATRTATAPQSYRTRGAQPLTLPIVALRLWSKSLVCGPAAGHGTMIQLHPERPNTHFQQLIRTTIDRRTEAQMQPGTRRTGSSCISKDSRTR